MLIRVKGYNGGVQEYLETGRMAGREFTRDELDERVILHGDLDLTRMVYESIEDKGQSRYTTYTLSFREDVVPEKVLHDITEEFRRFLLHAYREHEVNFYAEAHIPKIKEYVDKRTGERVERKPHIHVVVPRKNLLSGLETNPGGMHTVNEKYFEAFQEYINQKYNLSSPREHIRFDPSSYSSVLSRYKGDDFNAKNREFKQALVKQIIERDIRTRADFYSLVAEFGETRIRNKGKEGEYLSVKLPGDGKGTNLKESIFSDAFIVNRKLSKPPLDRQVIVKRLQDWVRVSREIKYVSKATPSFRQKYQQAPPEQQASLLKQTEVQFYRVNGEPHERKPRRERNGDHQRGRAQARPRDPSKATEGLQGLPGRVVAGGTGRSEAAPGALLLPDDARVYVRDEGRHTDPGLRTPVSDRGGKRRSTQTRRRRPAAAPETAANEREHGKQPRAGGARPGRLTPPPALRNPYKVGTVADIERHGDRLFDSLDRGADVETGPLEKRVTRRRPRSQGPRLSGPKKPPPYALNPTGSAEVSDIDLYTQRLFGSLQRSGEPDQRGRSRPRGALLDRYKAQRAKKLPLYAQNPHRVASVAQIEAQGRWLFSSLRDAPAALEAERSPTVQPAASSTVERVARRAKAKMLPPYALNKLRSGRVADIEAHSKRLFSALSTTGNSRYFAVERLKPIVVNKSASTVAAYLSRQHELDNLTGRQRAQIRRVDRKFYEVRHFLYQDHRLARKDRAQLLSILSFERMKAREAIKQPDINPEGFTMEASKIIRSLYDDDKYPEFSISGPGLRYDGPAGSIGGPETAQPATSRVRSIMDRLAKKVTPENLAKKTRELEEHDLYARKAKLSSNVHYVDKKTDKVVFVDTGKHIALRRTGLTESGVALALKMAKDRFGSTLSINGSAEFKKLVVEAAAKHNMDVHFTDKAMNQALEERKTELAIEREAEKIEPAAEVPKAVQPEATAPVTDAASGAPGPAAAAEPTAGPNLTVISFGGGTQVDFNSFEDINKTLKQIDAKLQENFVAKQEVLRIRTELREELKQDLQPETKAKLQEKLDDYTGTIGLFEREIKVLANDRDRLTDRVKEMREAAPQRATATPTAAPAQQSAQPSTPAQEVKTGPKKDSNGPIQGALLDHGQAPYEHDINKDTSYYVSLKTPEGVRTVWGKGLEQAMADLRPRQGETISLTDLGKQPVTVPRRQADGTVENIDTFRREWAVSSLDAPRRDEASFLVSQLEKALEQTGLTRSEFMEEPGQAARLAKMHASNLVTGSDATDQGKQLVLELMKDGTYREAFGAEVVRHFESLSDSQKATTQKFAGEAMDLAEKGRQLYGPVKSILTDMRDILEKRTGQTLAVLMNDPKRAESLGKLHAEEGIASGAGKSLADKALVLELMSNPVYREAYMDKGRELLSLETPETMKGDPRADNYYMVAKLVDEGSRMAEAETPATATVEQTVETQEVRELD